MITPKRVIKLARNWQKLVAAKHRRISFPGYTRLNSFVASKGHVVVYTTDGKRFMVPIELLSKNVFVELFRLSEEQFGIPSDGPITLPCDSSFLEYAIPLVLGCTSEDVERALLITMAPCHYLASSSSSLRHPSKDSYLQLLEELTR